MEKSQELIGILQAISIVAKSLAAKLVQIEKEVEAYEAAKAGARQEDEERMEALMRKKVFICSPFRGDMEGNARRAAVYSRMACEEGYLPIAPHLLFPQFLNEGIEEERRLGIAMGMELLALCDEVWVFGEATEGMAAEIASATEQGKIIIFKETEGM